MTFKIGNKVRLIEKYGNFEVGDQFIISGARPATGRSRAIQILTAPSSNEKSRLTASSASGWHIGMRSLVFLAARKAMFDAMDQLNQRGYAVSFGVIDPESCTIYRSITTTEEL